MKSPFLFRITLAIILGVFISSFTNDGNSDTTLTKAEIEQLLDAPRSDQRQKAAESILNTVDFIFTKLPSSNSEFDKIKKVYASFPAWNVKDSMIVEAYYSKYNGPPNFAYNHPGPDLSLPNWYYYWRQTKAFVLAMQDYGDPNCTPKKAGFYQPPESRFHICPGAAGSAPNNCGSPSPDDGIDLFAATELHESRHLRDWWIFWPAPNGYNQADDMDPPVLPDWNYWGDNVPDYLEGPGNQFPNLDPLLKDSDGNGYTDFDDFGYLDECTWSQGNADSEDWGYPGHRY